MTVICVGMGETTSTAEVQYRFWNFGGAKWREGIREDNFVRDKTLTGLGWDGVQGPGDGTGDWDNVYEEIY